jgi:hypothetical protein
MREERSMTANVRDALSLVRDENEDDVEEKVRKIA